MFIDDITEWLPDQLVQSNNVVWEVTLIYTSINRLRMMKQESSSSTLESMGLMIHQSEETHTSGNILDLIPTELG